MWSVVQIHSSRPSLIVALILLTNDDGYEAEGLRVLGRKLEEFAEVIVVAPDRERSAVSHGLTIQGPLELRQVGRNLYTLNGTPADCVIHALAQVTTIIPDLVISGINHGANLGDDIMYSGTVAGAREASHRGIPALAVSQAYDDSPIDFSAGVRYVSALVKRLLAQKSGRAVYFNVNIPVGKIRGVRVTRQGCDSPFPHFNSFDRATGAGSVSGGAEDPPRNDIPLDYQAVRNRWISITPLQRDQTDYAMVESLRKRGDRLFTSRRIPGLGLIGWMI
jgi:5'-nucleotidase